MTQPTNKELQAALDAFAKEKENPDPVAKNYRLGVIVETYAGTIKAALKFTMAANEPLKRTIYDAGAHAMHAEKDRLKETWGKTTDQYADTLSMLAFRAMTAKIWEEIK